MSAQDLGFLFVQVVGSIPKGKVSTYGQVAKLAGYPGYARQVGAALRNLPKDTNLPWFRVLNAQGRISLPKGGAGYHKQKTLLEDEGIQFQGDRVSLKDYGWQV